MTEAAKDLAVTQTITEPLSVHTRDNDGESASAVRPWMFELPIGEPDPIEQLEALRSETAGLKESFQALGAEMISSMAEWTPVSNSSSRKPARC